MPNPKMSHRTVPVNGEDVTYDIKDAVATSDIADIKAFIGYTEPNVIGLNADFENYEFTRLGDAVGLNAGSDFNKFPMYGNRKLCNLADDGTVNAWYGEQGYTENGSNGQVMVYQPKFYYKVEPIKKELIQSESTGSITSEPEGYHLLNVNYYISDKKLDGFKVHPAFLAADGITEMDGIYMGAYEGSIYDVSESKYLIYDDMSETSKHTRKAYVLNVNEDKFCSISGVKPVSGDYNGHGWVLSRTNVETMCQNRGSIWHSENIQIWSMEQLLFAIEYATFNSQSAIGDGVSKIGDEFKSTNQHPSVQTGATAFLGNNSGTATNTTVYVSGKTANYTANNDGLDKMSVRYRGRENDWGNTSKWINGINAYGNQLKHGGLIYYCNNYVYEESKNTDNYISTGIVQSNPVFGSPEYIRYFGWSDTCDWMFIPTSLGSLSDTSGGPPNSVLPVGDWCSTQLNVNDYMSLTVGGSIEYNNTSYNNPYKTRDGMYCWFSAWSATAYRYNFTCARICCLGPTSNSQ